MMPTRRILFLSQTLPFPPSGGAEIRIYHLLLALAEEHDVRLITFFRRDGVGTRTGLEENLRRLRAILPVDAFPIPQEHSRVRWICDHLRSVATGRPYTRYAYSSDAFTDRMRHVLREFDPHLVHLGSLDLSAALPDLSTHIVSCDHHNVESQLLSRRADAESGVIRRAYLRHQAKLTAVAERRWCSRFDLNLAVSGRDASRLARVSGTSRIAIVPNGVDVEAYEPHPGTARRAIFVGGANWFPNREALRYLHGDLLPRLRVRIPELRVDWVGAVEPQDLRRYGGDPNLELHGFVDDFRPLLRQASCYLVPLRTGGGTRLKILEAWAAGKAVVSTSIGCEGLHARDGKNILIRDDPETFCEGVEAIVRNPSLRTRLGQGGRRTAEARYAWERIGEHLLDVYSELFAA